jgi:hypothetical protein
MTKVNRMTTLADLTIGNPKTVLNLTAVPLSGNPAEPRVRDRAGEGLGARGGHVPPDGGAHDDRRDE